MLYKNRKDYDQKLKDLNTALYENANRAKDGAGEAPVKTEKSDRHTVSE